MSNKILKIIFTLFSFLLIFYNCESITAIPDTFNNDLTDTLVTHSIPAQFVFQDPHPNPFDTSTKFHISVPIECYLTLVVQNPIGDILKVIAAQNVEPGYYYVDWDGKNDNNEYVEKGLYFLTLEVKSKSYIESKPVKLER